MLFQQKHQTIMESAFKLFLQSGFASTSMDKIAKEASLSKATLYNHFKDKNELFYEVMAWHCQRLANSSRFDAYLKKGTLEEKLKSYAEALIWALREPRSIALMRVVIFECGQFPDLGKVLWKDGLPLLGDFCNFLRSEKKLHIPNIPIAARQFFGLIKENLVWPELMGLTVEVPAEDTKTLIEESVRMFVEHYSR